MDAMELSNEKALLPKGIVEGLPLTALAPMQDVTNLAFMNVVNSFGAPDYFFTEYFRVHAVSRLEKHILASVTENPTGRPVFAQIIGEDIEAIKRNIEELKKHPIAGIDLNMGCPAPKVYKKNVGGGLLRDVEKINQLLGTMRETVGNGLFTVKMRIGFEDTSNFDAVLDLINRHQIDLLSLHGRTVKEGYRSEVHYDFIKHAVQRVKCPVLANGNVTSAEKAVWVLEETGAAGVMIGRSAIRNPWIFLQFRQLLQGEPLIRPKLKDVFEYAKLLFTVVGGEESFHVNYLKKFMNFVAQGVDEEGNFIHEIRRVQDKDEFFEVCTRHLLDNGNDEKPYATEPYAGVIARPNCESNPTEEQGCSLIG